MRRTGGESAMVVSRAMDENIFLSYRALKRPRWKGRERGKKREAVQEMQAEEGRTVNICIPSRLERERIRVRVGWTQTEKIY